MCKRIDYNWPSTQASLRYNRTISLSLLMLRTKIACVMICFLIPISEIAKTGSDPFCVLTANHAYMPSVLGHGSRLPVPRANLLSSPSTLSNISSILCQPIPRNPIQCGSMGPMVRFLSPWRSEFLAWWIIPCSNILVMISSSLVVPNSFSSVALDGLSPTC